VALLHSALSLISICTTGFSMLLLLPSVVVGPIANPKGHYFQPSLPVSLSVFVCLSVCLSVCVSLTDTSTLER